MGDREFDRSRADATADAGGLVDDADAFEAAGIGPQTGPDPSTDASRAEVASVTDRLRARLRSPLRGFPSLEPALFLLVVTVAGSLFAQVTLPFGGASGLLGVASVAFTVGLADDQRRYAEFLFAGAVAAGAGTLLGNPLLAALGLGVPMVGLGLGTGGVAAVVGHYLGRDLRDGMTRDL